MLVPAYETLHTRGPLNDKLVLNLKRVYILLESK